MSGRNMGMVGKNILSLKEQLKQQKRLLLNLPVNSVAIFYIRRVLD
jgi:hypothetical protein